jgi:hypothetical protein
MELSPSWEAAILSAIQELPKHFMEPKGSLPCSQESATGACDEPDESSPYYSILSIKDPF